MWGEEYSSFYIEHILPKTKKFLNSRGLIVLATNSSNVTRFTELVDIVVDGGDIFGDKYTYAQHLDKLLIEKLVSKNINKIMYQNPDAYISHSAFERVLNTTKNVITLPGIRIHKEKFLDTYKKIDDDIMINAFNCLHPITTSLAIIGGNGKFLTSWPSIIYKIYDDKITCKAYHRHPLMFVIPNNYDLTQRVGTIDDRFIKSLGYTFDDYDNLINSDDGYVLEFSSDKYAWNKNNLESIENAQQAIINFGNSQMCSEDHQKYYHIEYTWNKNNRTV